MARTGKGTEMGDAGLALLADHQSRYYTATTLALATAN
ncbi:MAG: hypothetical protein AVDCRST_MAG59-3784, partial [uncultured Thermomicrobiales bacterium]